MIGDQTTEFTKENGGGKTDESALMGVSIRGWLAILITVTICGNWTANMALSAYGITSTSLVIPEPLYSAFSMVLGMFFGQRMNKK